MFRLAACALLALLLVPAAAGAAQPLTVDLSGTAPVVDKLDRYFTGESVALRVLAPQATQVTIAGVAPDGTTLRVPLVLGTDGAFAGTLTLATAGTWSLAADTTVGAHDVNTESFALLAVAPQSPLAASIMAGLALASVVGGIGLIAVARRT
ncbi:MAG TPA: hypothetical protein VGN14_16500 [Candidatus Elarobacter sp.]